MNSAQYIEYLTGIATLMNWVSFNEEKGYHFKFEGNQIYFDFQVTRRFLIGKAANKFFGKNPFLACQNPEVSFLQFLNVSRAVIRERDPYLHLIISGVEGDGFQFPHISPFVLSFFIDMPDKMSLISSHSLLDCRTFWIDPEDNETIHIPNHDILWTCPVLVLSEKAALLDAREQANGPSFKDLLEIKNKTAKKLKNNS